jgi:hypothetical protein
MESLMVPDVKSVCTPGAWFPAAPVAWLVALEKLEEGTRRGRYPSTSGITIRGMSGRRKKLEGVFMVEVNGFVGPD